MPFPRSKPFTLTIAVGLVVVVVVAASAVFGWGPFSSRLPGAQRAADDLAAALSQGRLPANVTAVAGADPAKELADQLAGMRKRLPQVKVDSVRLNSDDHGAVAQLHVSWALVDGLPAWDYTSQVALERPDRTWLVAWTPRIIHPDLQPNEVVKLELLSAERGRVLGNNDEAIVLPRPVIRVGIDRPALADDAEPAAARRLARALDINVVNYVKKVRGHGPKAFVEALVLRDHLVTASLRARLSRIPGVRMVGDVLPLAPSADFARPILGTVGPATAEAIERSGGRIKAGQVVGLSGLQALRNDSMMAVPGYRVVATGAEAKDRELTKIDARDGRSLHVSLDIGLQRDAEAVLAGVKPASAIVAIRPSDGHILVAASGPGGKGLSTALTGRFAPGSTFKTVTSLAALRVGLSPASEVRCDRRVVVNGMAFDNFQGYPASALGAVPLRTAFAHSCNAAFINLRDRIDQARLAASAEALGLTAEPALVVPAFLGSVPARAEEVEHAASMIGQGKILASPVGMATVAASIAHGRVVRPVLVLEDQEAPASRPATPLTPAEAEALRTLMRGVVTDGGARFLGDVPGGKVRAKTGTASYGDMKPPAYHGWMIAIQGDLAVAVFVVDATSGARTAGPLLRQFLVRVNR